MDIPSDEILTQQKRALRLEQKELRARCNGHESTTICTHIVNGLFELVPQLRTVGIYFPLNTEVDVLPAAQLLSQRGIVTALPVLQPDKSLIYARWRVEDPAEFDKNNVPRPFGALKPEVPQAILVPLLAFDKRGMRLGYGGGSYDRYLAEQRQQGHILAMGVAYEQQHLDRVPTQAHDMPLDVIVTQQGVLVCPPFAKQMH